MFSNVPVIYHFKSKNDDRKEREETPDNKKICQSKRGEKYKHEKTDDVITVDTSRVHRLITVASQNSFCVSYSSLYRRTLCDLFQRPSYWDLYKCFHKLYIRSQHSYACSNVQTFKQDRFSGSSSGQLTCFGQDSPNLHQTRRNRFSHLSTAHGLNYSSLDKYMMAMLCDKGHIQYSQGYRFAHSNIL